MSTNHLCNSSAAMSPSCNKTQIRSRDTATSLPSMTVSYHCCSPSSARSLGSNWWKPHVLRSVHLTMHVSPNSSSEAEALVVDVDALEISITAIGQRLTTWSPPAESPEAEEWVRAMWQKNRDYTEVCLATQQDQLIAKRQDLSKRQTAANIYRTMTANLRSISRKQHREALVFSRNQAEA